MHMRAISVAILSTAILVGGCAKKASDIQANYQDPRRFDSYLCHQLRDEASRVARRAADAYDEQNSKASIRAVVAAPRALFRGGETSDVAVARLKGEMQAIESASARKNCGVLFRAGNDGAAPTFTGSQPVLNGPATVRSIYNAPRV